MHKMLTGWTFCKCRQTKFLATPGKLDGRFMQEDACGDDNDEHVFAFYSYLLSDLVSEWQRGWS